MGGGRKQEAEGKIAMVCWWLATAGLVPGARLLAIGHPVLRANLEKGQMESYRKVVWPLLEMSEDDMLKLVPTQSGLCFVGCVNGSGARREGQLTLWDVREPYRSVFGARIDCHKIRYMESVVNHLAKLRLCSSR